MITRFSLFRSTFLLLLSMGFLLAPTPVKGQVDVRPGLRVGVTSTTIGGSGTTQEMGRQTGVVAGGFVHLDLPGPFSLQPELLYVQKGAERTPEIGIPEIESVVYDLDYIELPLLVQGQLPTGGSKFSPILMAGPTLGVNIASEVKTEMTEHSQRVDLEDPHATEVGLSVGLGGDYRLGNGAVSADVRYQLGLTDTFGDSDAFARNQGIAITAGFSF